MSGLAELGNLWHSIQTWLFPMLEDELGELDEKHREFVAVCETCQPRQHMAAYRWIGNGCPPKDRLSSSQRNRLEWFNIELMNRLLYPGTLRLAFTRNYVPNNLTSPTKTWRDVYRYDNTGRLTGWTRYDADKITNFTPDGKAVPSSSLYAHHAAPADGPYPRPAGRENVGASVFDLQDLARPAAIRPASNRGHACP